MKMIVMLLIGLGIAGAVLYVYTEQQTGTQEQVEQQQEAAQEAVDDYRANQQRMMEEIAQ